MCLCIWCVCVCLCVCVWCYYSTQPSFDSRCLYMWLRLVSDSHITLFVYLFRAVKVTQSSCSSSTHDAATHAICNRCPHDEKDGALLREVLAVFESFTDGSNEAPADSLKSLLYALGCHDPKVCPAPGPCDTAWSGPVTCTRARLL